MILVWAQMFYQGLEDWPERAYMEIMLAPHQICT